MLSGANQILDERGRQRDVEKFSAEHDDKWSQGELISAAVAYCYSCLTPRISVPPTYWPWPLKWFKPKDPIRNLVRAGALIAAEIDRLQRIQEDHQ